MIYLKLLFALLFPLILGYSVVNTFLNKKDDVSFLGRIALGYLLGLMLITLEMAYILPNFNIRYSVFSVSAPLIPIMLIGLYFTLRNGLLFWKPPRFIETGFQTLNILEKLFLLLIALQVIFVFSASMIKPVVGVDAWANYSLRAKAYFIEGTNNIKTIPPSGRGDHVALTQTWVFTCLNQWNDLLGKINFPFSYIGLLIVFYYAVRRMRSRTIALLSTVMLATLPFLVYHATLEYSDFIIAVYLFTGVTLLFYWFNTPKIGTLLLAFIFLLSTPTIKNEAYLHLVLIMIVFMINVFSKKLSSASYIKWIRWMTAAGIFFGGTYTTYKVLHAREIVLLSPNIYFARITPMLQVFGNYLFIRSNWNIVWFILILLVIFNYKKLKEHFNLALLACFELAGIMLFYLTAAEDVYSWLFYVTPAVRNILQFMPIVMFLLANLLSPESLSPFPLQEDSRRPPSRRLNFSEKNETERNNRQL